MTSDHPKRILHVTEAPLGGVVACLEEMLASQVAVDFDSVQLITREININALGDIKSPRFRVVTFRHDRKSVWTPIRLAWLTVKHVRATRAEILHLHSTIAGAAVRSCKPFLPASTKIVYCPHGWAFLREGGGAVNWAIAALERVLSRLCDRIICVSEHEKQQAIAVGIPDQRIVVIENGISPRYLAAPAVRRNAGGKKLIIFAGRFDRQKGFDTYIEVLRQLHGEALGIAIGRSIVSDAEFPDLPENLEILGWQPRARVFELYTQADLLLVPSRWEGFGLVAIEAMQAKLAVFASRVGGLQDIVVDGETGRLFEPDRVDMIVTLIQATSAEDLQAYGERGYARYLRRYTAQRMNERVMDLYCELRTCLQTERADRC